MPKSRSARWHAAICVLICLLLVIPAIPIAPPAIAQDLDCPAEVEPNNVEAEAEARKGEFCISGQLVESSDQELIVWSVSEDDAKFVWNLRIEGVAQTVTSAKVLSIQSDPGVTPVVAGAQLLDIGTVPGGELVAERQFLVAPGSYLIGISRSDTADQSLPVDTGYLVSLSRAERLPKRLDDEPNDDRDTATQIAGEVSFAGDLFESSDFYAWTVSDDDARSGWAISILAALGTGPDLAITAEDGTRILYAYPDAQYRLSLFDLAFAPGKYSLAVGPNSTVPTPYLVRIMKEPMPVGDVEPNDEPAYAAVLDPANPVVKGRLASTNDVDLYRLGVDDQLAGSLLDLKVLTRSEISRQVCLASVETGLDLKCADGPGGAAITNLLLPRGQYIVRITGEADPNDEYIMRFDLTSAPSPDFEAEPNDDLAFATALEAGVAVRGTFDPNDFDSYQITVVGEPQLWD
ncbi:MAG: hypothetical protein M3Y37_07790, partial [Chloroflexota bacterium]|nr:hypothetical protein [Chloroflexota bacterium]